MTIRVLLADDEALLHMAFTTVLDTQPDMRPVGGAADGDEAVRLARQLRPDVVVMDVRMPGADGIEATRRIIRVSPQSRVLILTTFDLDAYAFAGLKAGASGFLPKNVRPESLLTAIRDVAAGDAVVSPGSPAACWRTSPRTSPAAAATGGMNGCGCSLPASARYSSRWPAACPTRRSRPRCTSRRRP